MEAKTAGTDTSAHSRSRGRPRVGGKFLFAGDEKIYVRGVTYGAFRPDAQGNEYHDLAIIERDFAQMAANGINTVRIPHTTPPVSLLDAAHRHGLWVMVGLSAEQHLGFVIDKRRDLDPERVLRERVQQCAGHPALLCYALGNEIPTLVARWYGRRLVEKYLERLYWAVRQEDPEGLVTYVNYPSTEYLQLPFLDLVCYNVYLEQQDALESYVARLQNIASDRPLILSEVGLDSLRNGVDRQARSLEWQIRTAFASGCAGVFVFAWTDEWHRAGAQVDDWAFGITDRERQPKPGLAAVRNTFREIPFPPWQWPRISVVICTLNGSRTIRECLERMAQVDYPNFEVIVVDDGSTDGTAEIAREYDVRLIRTANQGLSSARNTGLAAAAGDIVAYLDDDAYPDPQWLSYLAAAFETTDHAGVGGPNIPPSSDGLLADCIANAPGGPTHVLLSDQVAEHIPGCNMAFRKDRLEAIGGFDPQFRVAGDDVDVCWQLQERGWTLGFHPAAMVWHHRRDSAFAYWKQQRGYGQAEALLKHKWPEKYNGSGQLSWAGRIYSRALTKPLNGSRGRIFHGTWGAAPFQRLYQSGPSTLYSLPLMPEWYLAIPILGGLSALGLLWRPLLLALPILAVTMLVPVVQASLSTAHASFASVRPRSRFAPRYLAMRLMTTLLHLLHPLARLSGRLKVRRGSKLRRVFPCLPRPRAIAHWTERGEDHEGRLRSIERELKSMGAVVWRGGDWDGWDLEVVGGALGAARLIVAVEDHGAGAQLQRYRWWPRLPSTGVALTLASAVLAAAAALDGVPAAAVILGAVAAALALRSTLQCGAASAAIQQALRREDES